MRSSHRHGLIGTALSLLAMAMPGTPLATAPRVADVEDLGAVIERAEQQVEAGRLPEGLSIYDAALAGTQAKAVEGAALLHLNRGVIRYRLGQLEEALADFDAGVPDHDPEVRRRCLFNRGRVLVDLARRSAPDRRAPVPLRPEESLGLLVEARRDFVAASTVRPSDRRVRESLQAISEEMLRWRRRLGEPPGGVAESRPGPEAPSAVADAASMADADGAGAAAGIHRRTGREGARARREGSRSRPPAEVTVPELTPGDLDDLRRRLAAGRAQEQEARRRRQGGSPKHAGRDW